MTRAMEEHGEDLASRVAAGRTRILEQLRLVIVGQDEVVDQVLIALFTGGHCLLTGVPGLAKTLLIKTLASILDLSFKRIQFTPDLMPADITGTEILDEADGVRGAALRAAGRSSRRSSSPTRSTARRPRPRRRCSRRCRSSTSPPPAAPTRSSGRSSSWRRRTRSSSRAPIRCPKRSSIASCSTSTMTYLSEDDEVRVVTADDRQRPSPARAAC